MTQQEWNVFLQAYQPPKPKAPYPAQIRMPLADGREILIRPEEPADYREVERITRAAFWKEPGQTSSGELGANEHYLAHILRPSREFIPQLDLVAVCEGAIAGNIMYTIGCVKTSDQGFFPAPIFGPLSVRPDFQRKGVGSALMRHSIQIACSLGYAAIFLFGHPEYYPRFGFSEAGRFGITTSDGSNFPAFMAMELFPGALSGITGSFHYSPLYDPDPESAAEFDRMLMN